MPGDVLSAEVVAAVAREAVPGAATRVERIHDGVSTLVYRVSSERGTWYLRVLPDPAHSFAPEVTVHARLRALGVRVPEVVFFADPHPLLARSAIVLEALPGAALFHAAPHDPVALEQIVADAGRDLARLGNLRVDGFGRVARRHSAGTGLAAPWTTYREAALSTWEADLAALARLGLTDAEGRALERLVATYDAWLDVPHSQLAHGDFSIRHIFQHQGAYSGIIDLSDMRGAGPWDDLAYFHMRDGARLSVRLLPALLRGFGAVVPLPPDVGQRIRFAALLRNVASLPDALAHRPHEPLTQHQLARLREDLAAL